MELTRRHALAGAAALAATPLLPNVSAKAAAPAAEKQAPSFYRYKVGDAQVNVISDGVNNFALGDTFVLNVKKDEVNAALEKAFMPKDKMSIQFAPLVINTGGKLVVVDTGNGPAAFASSKGNVGQFASNMAAAGLDPKAVDMVVISHFHGDHINGLLTADNTLAFPNAEVLVPAAEWKYFMDDGEMAKQTSDRMKGVFANARRVFDAGLKKKVTPMKWARTSRPGLQAVATHRPHAGPHLVRSVVGLRQGVHPVRRHQPSGAVRHQSGLAPDVRPGSGDGGSHPPQGLRHAGGRQDAGPGLPLSVPGQWLCREGWQRLPAGAGAMEPGDLNRPFRSTSEQRPPVRAAFVFCLDRETAGPYSPRP